MKMVKCTNCGAEIPTDASFCENCGAKVTPAVATPPPPPAAVPPPPPAATQVTYPPPPPTTPEKKGPPMKTIGIVVAVIIVVLGGVLFMANSATRGLSVSLQSGSVITTYPLPGDITITLSLNIENPGFMSVEVVNNYLTIRCRSSGRQATFYSGYVSELRGTYSGSTLKTVTITLPWGTWANDASIVAVWVWGCWNEAPMQMEIEGTLDTRSLFLTGTSTVSVDWISVRGY
jgi:hypothetical protein